MNFYPAMLVPIVIAVVIGWLITKVVGCVSAKPKPLPVWLRNRCFMDTVSPARNRVRSNTVWANSSRWALLLVGTLKRQGSMPRFQSLQVKAMSCTPALVARALTK